MSKMISRLAMGAVASLGMVLASASFASPVVFETNTDFSSAPTTITFDGSSFTFSGTGDPFNPTAIQTSGGGEVSSSGGFFGFPVEPSTDFYPARGSGTIEFGPTGTAYSQFASTTVVPYSNGGNVFGLVALLDGLPHYGFALTSDTSLVSYGFESLANTPIDATAGIAAAAAPEPATWMMMILGFGFVGGVMRRAYRKSEENFTRKVRSLATA